MLQVNGKEFKFLNDLRAKDAPKTNYYGFFPDGTPLMKFDVDADTDGTQYRITWLYENLMEQVILQNLVWHMQEKNPSAKITLNLPYVPNARMDRTHHEDEVATLKNFTRFINELGFYKVYVLDPHSNVAPQLLNKVHVNENALQTLMATVIGTVKPDFLFYPDDGCKKRLETKLKYPYITGWKDRDWETGNILGTEVIGANKVTMEGATVLILDDISSYGGTFLHAAKKLKELGVAKIYLYVTHCENSILAGELINSGLLEGIFTTNTIFRGAHKLITVLNREE